MALGIDQITLNFNPASLNALNAVIGLVMYGIALDFSLEDFKDAIKKPKAFVIGLICQFIFLPALAFGVSKALGLSPSIALGLLLVSSCPGGNLSNLFTAVSKGNAALSVAMSTVSTLLSIIMTPLNLAFWGSIEPGTRDILRTIHLDPWKIVFTVAVILVIPCALGIATQVRFPEGAKRWSRKMNAGSFIAFILFTGVAFVNNYQYFLDYVGKVFWPVMWTNFFGIGLAFIIAMLFRLKFSDAKAIGFEVGIQNAAFGLILVFNFFEGLGGMAVVAAWWGIWHVITGGSLALGLLGLHGKKQAERNEKNKKTEIAG